MSTLPEGRLLAFYGDDFTGSAAVMELMSFAGLPTVLFTDVPSPAELERFAHCRAIGIAGVARSRSPAWMDAELPRVFQALAGLGAPISHYKTCSTFDSAPHVGSIGRAIDLAVPELGGAWHPLLVGAPAIQRYQLFGNLFAVVDGEGYRLDRHPTMAHHPVTPMHEADVRVHLAEQTARPIGLVDYLAITGGRGDAALADARAKGAEIVAIDVIDEASLAAAGRLIWENRAERLFAAGSQGVEYALLAYWREAGLIGDPPPRKLAEHARIAAVSGSCSPVTARQIDWAEANGFAAIRLDAVAVVDEQRWLPALDAALDEAITAFKAGMSPLIYSASGPADPSVAALAGSDQGGRARRRDGQCADRPGAGQGAQGADCRDRHPPGGDRRRRHLGSGAHGTRRERARSRGRAGAGLRHQPGVECGRHAGRAGGGAQGRANGPIAVFRAGRERPST